MTTTVAVLFESKLAEDTDTLQYTSTGVRTSIDKLTAHNTTGSPATLTINLLAPSTAPASASVTVVKAVAAGATYAFPEVVGHNLDIGGMITTKASAPGALAIRASGRQFS